MTEQEQREFEDFMRWKKQRTSPLENAFNELHEVIEHPTNARMDNILSVKAFDIIARCLIELKRELER